MFSSSEKTVQPVTVQRQQSKAGESFFRKAGDEPFFGANESKSFFSAPVQAKLQVSHPDDPQEKEADAVAENVMRMADTGGVASGGNKEELQRKEEPVAQEEKKEEKIQRSALSPVQGIRVQRQSQPEEKEKVHAKLFNTINRQSAGGGFINYDSDTESDTGTAIHAKLDSASIMRSGRGPPQTGGSGITSFEQTLTSTKGQGSPMSGDTRQSMETRFGADFSGVRIHTGSYAENLSRSINAHAFTHGNDIYFNSGKYAPATASGGTLLAHELTHTIQQGASHSHTSTGPSSGPGVATKSINRKISIQRSAAAVPSQLTNAVEKAKTVEGKIDANKPQADGFRTGWEHLVEIFKTTFGEDKIISGAGGTTVEGAVAEQDIKKKREQDGVMVVDATTTTDRHAIPGTKTGSRDAMPSWCGIFVFWALNKSGVPMPKWKLGERMIKPEAARLPGTLPMPGDIAYRNAFSHFAIVDSVNGDTVKTVNGNTAGEDNLGGQVQTKDHPLSDWTAFFNPLLIMQGSLGQGESAAEEKPKTLNELRKELFNVSRKEAPESIEEKKETNETRVDAKQEVSSPVANAGVETNAIQLQAETEELQKKEEEHKEEEKVVSPKLFSLHKKADTGSEAEHEYAAEGRDSACCPVTVQAKEIEDTGTGTPMNIDNTTTMSADVNSRGPPVQLQNSGNTIQCGWFDDALSFVDSAIDFVAEGLEAGKRLLLNEARDFVMAIPGYRALRVVLGSDPITGEEIERNGHTFIEAAFDIMPGGRLLHEKLTELGALDEAAQWIDNGIAAIEALVSNVVSRVESFWNGLTLESLASPSQIFEDAGNIIHSTISEVVDYAVSAATELLEIVKKWLLTQVVGFIRERTTAYPLLCVILGQDPITEEEVERNGTTILSAILELGGEEGIQQRTQMQETGTFQKAADWIDRGIGVFSNLLQTIRDSFGLIWSVVSIDALMHPIDKFMEIYNTFATPVADVLQFMADVAVVILQFIKEALMQRLSAWARTVRGYFLVTVIIGKDPFTDAVVPRNVENIIHGFMSLMEGGEEQFNQMKESGSIARATQRINAAVARLNMTPASIVQLFIDLWNSFSIQDLVDPIAAFQRIIDTFGEPIGRLIAFVVEIVKIVVVVILEIMNFPFDLINNIIKRTIAAFHRIKNDPIGFLKNLLRAIKQGFIQFFDNIVQHLIGGVVGWLMSELRDAGIPELTDFSLRGVIGWVLEVLGISMEKIWEKLAAHPRIGPERVARLRSMINTLDGIWTFIKDVQERGVAAIWEKIQEQLTNLWNTVIDAVKNWVMEKIVAEVTVKLLSMLDPTGIMAVINSCIAIYKAIQSFIRYLREMLEVLNSFVNGVADIAEGNVATAANYLENTMGRAMPIVVGFLANQVGLGGVGRRVGEMIESVREMVDQALTWLVNRAVDTGFAIFDRLMVMGRNAASAVLGWARGLLGLQQPFTTTDGVSHRIYFTQEGDAVKLKLNPSPAGDYEQKMNEINPPPGAMVNVTSAISVPLKRNGAVVATINVPAGSTSMAALKGFAIQAAQHLDGLIRSGMRTSTDAATQVQDQTPDFSASLAGLSSITSHLLSAGGPSGPLPVTPLPVYGGLVNGFGSSMDVKPLTKMGVPGSGVGITSPGWEDLNLRKHSPGGSFFYVRGHLLNNNVHGSGSTWQNLTPINRDTNAQHVSAVESKVKEAVEKDLILHYNVTVQYAMTRKANLISQIEATPNWSANSVLNEKHKILEAEANLPIRLNCTLKQIKADGTDLPASDPTYDPKYNISGAPGIIENEANISQNTLDEYFLANPTAVTYKDLATLITDANLAITSNSGLTWNTFYNNPANKVSIDNLSAPDKETLQNVFRKKDLIMEERSRINNQMAMVNWGAFTSDRVAYTGGLLAAADITELHDRFKARMVISKGFFLSSLTTYVNTRLTDPNTEWRTFRSVQQLNERAYEYPAGNMNIILSESEIQTFRTTVFNPRINFLRTSVPPAP